MAALVDDHHKMLQDPFERFPTDIIQLIVDRLPLCDNWRLRLVNRRWNEYLTGPYAMQAAAQRWNTHAADQRASFQSRPSTTSAEDVHRMKSFLSGQPVAQATITPELSPGEHSDIYNLQMSGKWLACRTNFDPKGPMHIQLWDLVTGDNRRFTTKPTRNLGFNLSSYLITYTTYDEAYGRQEWKDEPLDNVLNIIDLRDFSLHERALPHNEPMQQSIRLTAHKSCVVVMRHRGVLPYDERVDVFDLSDDTVSSFNWTVPVSDTMSYKFRVDADLRLLTIWSAFTRYAPGTSPGMENMVLRCMVAIDQFSFAGDISASHKKEIHFHDDDFREMHMFGPWIMALQSAGGPDTWSAHINFWPVEQVETVMRIDWSSASEHINAYYRSHTGALVWKNMVFYLDTGGDLRIGRNSFSSEVDTTPVSRIKLRSPHDKIGDGESKDDRTLELKAVNESFLVICDDRSIRVYAFDALMCQLTPASTADQSTQVKRQTDTGEDNKLIWKSTNGCFLKDEAPSIAYTRTEPQRAAGEASGPDPVLDTLKRLSDMLGQPL